MAGVQFGSQIDMNGFKITELGPGVAPTDAVNVSQLSAAIPQGFAQTIGDGVASTFSITHGLGLTDKNDFIARVAEVSSGVTYLVEVTGVDGNTISVTFGMIPTAGQFRVSVVPVP